MQETTSISENFIQLIAAFGMLTLIIGWMAVMVGLFYLGKMLVDKRNSKKLKTQNAISSSNKGVDILTHRGSIGGMVNPGLPADPVPPPKGKGIINPFNGKPIDD